MSSHSDFADCQDKEGYSPVLAAPPYDFFEQAAQQNRRDEDSRVEYRARKEHLQLIPRTEACERCGKELRRVFVWNGKRLCGGCVDAGKKTWIVFTGGPNAPPRRAKAWQSKRVAWRPHMESLISGFLALFGLERIEKAIGTLGPGLPMRWAHSYRARMQDKKQMPQAEGIRDTKKRRRLFLRHK